MENEPTIEEQKDVIKKLIDENEIIIVWNEKEEDYVAQWTRYWLSSLHNQETETEQIQYIHDSNIKIPDYQDVDDIIQNTNIEWELDSNGETWIPKIW